MSKGIALIIAQQQRRYLILTSFDSLTYREKKELKRLSRLLSRHMGDKVFQNWITQLGLNNGDD